MIDVNEITVAVMVKNEEYWIHYVLRDAFKLFPNIIVLDTGSTDKTIDIILATANTVKRPEGSNFTLLTGDYGNDAFAIGNGRNVLRKAVKTKWMLLVDGDEIWTIPQLEVILATDIPDGKDVVMAGSHNVEDVAGKLMFRTHDIANKDIMFMPEVEWTKTDYPFEGYGLTASLSMDKVYYLPADQVYCYHMRHTKRSSQSAFFREEKYGYFPYAAGHHEFDMNLLGDALVETPNPYAV